MTSGERDLAAEGPFTDFPRKCAALGGGGQSFSGTLPPVCWLSSFLDHFLLCVLEATSVYIMFLACSKHTFVLCAKILPLACLLATLPMTCRLLGKVCGGFLFNCAHSFRVPNITIPIELNAHSQRNSSENTGPENTVWRPSPFPCVFVILANYQKMAEGRVIFPTVMLKCWLANINNFVI